jgi:hypothetical protein
MPEGRGPLVGRALPRGYAKASPFERAALLVRIVAAVQKGAR